MYPPQGPPGPAGPPYGAGPAGASAMPDPERVRRRIGCGCYGVAMLGGVVLLFLLFIILPLATQGVGTLIAMAVGACLAFPAALVYLTVPRLLDRYDPEPAYALLMALAWGAIAACGVSAVVNTLVGGIIGGEAGEIISTVVSAPIIEEATKGVLVLGFFYFLRREFDGVVDGIIYATFCAIGFAAVENVIYYANAGLEAGAGGMIGTFVVRGVLAPWGHPLYTSMTGIGIGIARETDKVWLRPIAPVLGYAAAVFLHAVWNGTAIVLGSSEVGGLIFLFIMLPLWLLFVAAFLAIVIVLVRRRGKIIRSHLLDEVALGHLTKAELELVASAFGGLTAYFRKGKLGVEFVRAVARLALSKWHTGRAVKTSTRTVSMDFIAPLRRRIRELRAQGASPA
ncbi:MAG: PrsW family intramembrane metalloprotease [Sandaracinaceae bacterium]|nr:MAG: PrsW family intramembrane metalloprotease [Sandaracinaceae bacterium]HBQ14699.1 PrsW family intramembrane metalloprotease [Myxococcales bacterium]